MKKKLLSVVLALALCLGLATTALAAEAKTYEGEYIKVTNVLSVEEKENENGYPWQAFTCVAPVTFEAGSEYADLYSCEKFVQKFHNPEEVTIDSILGVTGDDIEDLDIETITEAGAYLVGFNTQDSEDGGYGYDPYLIIVVAADDTKTEDTKTEANNTETTTPSTDTGFADVAADDYYAEAVAWAVEQGITKGVSNTRFAPEETCTRAQIITFLWRAAAVEPGATAEITDVSSEDYYYDAVMWAKDLDMFEGNTFLPNDPCTRLTAVEFMWTAAKKPTAAASSFSDVKSNAVNWAVAAGVTTGTEPGKFSPNETCTRGQIVTFLWRAYAEAE